MILIKLINSEILDRYIVMSELSQLLMIKGDGPGFEPGRSTREC